MKGNILVSVIGSLFLSLSVCSQSLLEPIQRIDIISGLAHNGVTCLTNDSRGYMWIGTYDGLNKYDGHEMATFKNEPEKKILKSNRIRTLVEDQNQNLWIGTDRGINIYNLTDGSFSSPIEAGPESNEGLIVRKILFENEANLAICATEDSGVLVIDISNKSFKSFSPNVEIGQRVRFFDGILLEGSKYLFSTSAGLFLFDSRDGTFSRVLPNEIGFSHTLYRQGDELLVAEQNGLAVCRLSETKEGYQLKLKSLVLEGFSVRAIALDVKNQLWLGTSRNGVLKFNSISDAEENVNVSAPNISELKSLRVSSVFPSASSGCWVGTFDKGVMRFEISESSFRSYSDEMGYSNGVVSNNASKIMPYSADDVVMWAGTENHAIFNPKKQSFRNVPFMFNPISESYGYSILPINQLTIQYGSDPEKLIIKNFEGTAASLDYANKSLKSGKPRAAFEVHNEVWVLTTTDVFRFKLSKPGKVQQIERLSDNPDFSYEELDNPRAIYKDPMRDFVWIGTTRYGLFRIEVSDEMALKNARVSKFQPSDDRGGLKSPFVSCIVRLNNNELWIGTEGAGIARVDNDGSNDPKFISYTEKDGLSNNVVKAILEDENGHLWITTNIGLNKFDVDNRIFRKFGKSDGLPFEDFIYSNAKLEDGTMFFLGPEGLCYFHPDDIKKKEPLPYFEFDNLRILGKPIKAKDTIDGKVILSESLSSTEELILEHDQNVFSIDVISLHYSNPENHLIKYQLTPVNADWITAPSNEKTVNYTGLQPGKYTLRAQASNSLNQWTALKELNIRIKPPFWRTTNAYFMYALALIALSVGSVYLILKFQSMLHRIQMEHLHAETADKINEAKLRFFSNISHEIKTPLTLITSPISYLKERLKLNEDISEKLNIMQRQAMKIQSLVSQVHDFQRADANLLSLNTEGFWFQQFLEEQVKDFEFLAINDHKQFKVIGERSDIYVKADKDKLEKVLNNLLSNAFKFTAKDDTISLHYQSSGQNLVIKVEDTGRGIHPDDLPHIFDRFYQSEKKQFQHQGGSGIGLAFAKRLVEMHLGFIGVKSELGKGSEFEVRLPVVKEAPAENEAALKESILREEQALQNKPVILTEETHQLTDDSLKGSSVFLAEDIPEMRHYVSKELSKHFTVRAFEDGQKCKDALVDDWPEILISDVLMPELNGLDLCEHVKSDMKLCHIPVILLTACTDINDKITGLQVGADAYIEKPFNLDHLITRVETLLQSRKRLRERFLTDLPLKLDGNTSNGNDAAFLEKLFSLMAENVDNEELDINMFARELGLNRNYFYQKLKALTGHTPFDLFKSYRLKKAAEYLVQEGLSVNEAFMKTGFKSRSNFSKLFKDKFGVPPGKYAEHVEEKELV